MDHRRAACVADAEPSETARPGRRWSVDAFLSVNAALFLLMCVFAYWERWSAYMGSGRAAEFVLYAAVIVVAIVAIRAALPRRDAPAALFVLVEVGILAHFAGGLVRYGGARLYDHLFLGVRYDKYVHAANALIACVVLLALCRFWRVRPSGFVRFLVFLAVLGLGALIELVEYGVTRTLPEHGIGGYEDTIGDLVANVCGGALFLAFGRWTDRLAAAPSLPQERTPAPAAPAAPASPWRRRVVVAICLVLGLPAAVLAFAAFGVWSESRFPSDAPDATAFSRARGVLTKPVVDLLGDFASRHVRETCERRLRMTGATLEETIAGLHDAGLDDPTRAVFAMRLARVGSPEAIDALVGALRAADGERRAFLAQLVGSTGDPRVATELRPLLADRDERVVLAAVRGLAAVEGGACVEDLAAVLADRARPVGVRVAAARGLGATGRPSARDALAGAFAETPRGDLSDEILRGLAGFAFEDVAGIFRGLLSSPGTSASTRATAVDALSRSTQDAVPFLLEAAARDRDAAVRASAAWAISALEEGDVGSELAALAERERDPEVRRRLYEAVAAQRTIPAERLFATVAAETDVAARVAGFGMIGRAVGRDPGRPAARRFDAETAPELARIASSPNSLNVRLRAVFGLRFARSEAARRALAEVAGADCREVAEAARHGLNVSQ